MTEHKDAMTPWHVTVDTSAAAIAVVLEGVTAGPWTDEPDNIDDAEDYSVDREDDNESGLCWSGVGNSVSTVALVVVPSSFGMDQEQAANSRFIAWCREGVPALSAELTALRAERHELSVDYSGMELEAFHRAQERDAALARVAVLETALRPFAFTEFKTTQDAWEVVANNRGRDWVDFQDIDQARFILAHKGADE